MTPFPLAPAPPPRPTFADPAAPCGPSLEYDNDFLVLQALLQPAPDVQYGRFTGRREGPDWPDVERQCRALLQRSCDINLLVWLTRCRARQAGAQGLQEGLACLAEALRRHGAHIHPQPEAGDASVRANALAALADPEGLLADVRELAVGGNAAGRLAVRDVERALLHPRPADAATPEAVRAQIDDLQRAAAPELAALQAAAARLGDILAWCRAQLGEHAPDLSALVRLLAPFAATGGCDSSGRLEVASVLKEPPDAGGTAAQGGRVTQEPAQPPASGEIFAASARSADVAESPDAVSVQAPSTGGDTRAVPALWPDRSTAGDPREQARAALICLRRWFEQHEPSSPVCLMLLQAERLVGRPYAEVADALPPELIARWSGPQ
jgi:type VI secretion system protein ImpA